MDPVGLLAVADPSRNKIKDPDHCCEANRYLPRREIVMLAWVNAHDYGLLPSDDKIPSGVIETAAHRVVDDVEYDDDGMLGEYSYTMGKKRAEKDREYIRDQSDHV
jgi:hypothetical protein